MSRFRVFPALNVFRDLSTAARELIANPIRRAVLAHGCAGRGTDGHSPEVDLSVWGCQAQPAGLAKRGARHGAAKGSPRLNGKPLPDEACGTPFVFGEPP